MGDQFYPTDIYGLESGKVDNILQLAPCLGLGDSQLRQPSTSRSEQQTQNFILPTLTTRKEQQTQNLVSAGGLAWLMGCHWKRST